MAEKPKSLFHSLWNRRAAYRALFKNNKATVRQRQTILDDLREYCNAGTLPIATDKHGATDMYQTGKLHGKQEVLLYLQQILELTDEKLFEIKDMEETGGDE